MNVTSEQIKNILYFYKGSDNENEVITDALEENGIASLSVKQLDELHEALVAETLSFTNCSEDDPDCTTMENYQDSIDDSLLKIKQAKTVLGNSSEKCETDIADRIVSPGEQLIKKASAEFNEYIAEVKKSGADNIIKSAYEISTKKDIILTFQELSNNEAEQLLTLGHPVESVYQGWLSNSYNPGTELLKDTIEDTFLVKQESNAQLPFPNVGIKHPIIPPQQFSLKR